MHGAISPLSHIPSWHGALIKHMEILSPKYRIQKEKNRLKRNTVYKYII
jgi:hypothetical protein